MEKGELRSTLEPIVKGAGEILRKHYLNVRDRHYKGDGSFATEADLASEKYLLEHLKEVVPGAAFLAEESGAHEGNEYAWVIDPLDGTTNFAHGLPYFCISVALTRNAIPEVGIIYQPLLDEFFYAERGKGAFLNGSSLEISQKQSLSDAFVLYEFSYVEDSHFTRLISGVNGAVYSMRSCGAAALDLAYCAAGRADCVLLGKLSWWDVAAGMLLIEESGGVVSTFLGEKITPNYPDFMGGNKPICTAIKPILAE